MTNNIGQNNQQHMDTFGMCWLQNPSTTKLTGLYVLLLQRAYVYTCIKPHVMFT